MKNFIHLHFYCYLHYRHFVQNNNFVEIYKPLFLLQLCQFEVVVFYHIWVFQSIQPNPPIISRICFPLTQLRLALFSRAVLERFPCSASISKTSRNISVSDLLSKYHLLLFCVGFIFLAIFARFQFPCYFFVQFLKIFGNLC